MTGRKYYWTGIVLIAAGLLTLLVAYPHLPNIVPTHWNVRGEANGFSPKWALFAIFPGMMAGLMALFAALPWLSPQRFEVDSFRLTYLYIMVIVMGLLLYVEGVTLWTALSGKTNPGSAIIGGICLLTSLLGNVMGKVRRNFYIGIRTPWTLADERVWNATHRFAAKTFFWAGVAGLAMTLFGAPPVAAFVAVMCGVLLPVVYSLIIYKQLERSGENVGAV